MFFSVVFNIFEGLFMKDQVWVRFVLGLGRVWAGVWGCVLTFRFCFFVAKLAILSLHVHFFRLPERNEPKKGQRRRSSPTNMRSSAEARELAPPSAPLRHHSPLTASIALFVAGISLKPRPKRTFFICARGREHVGRVPVGGGG